MRIMSENSSYYRVFYTYLLNKESLELYLYFTTANSNGHFIHYALSVKLLLSEVSRLQLDIAQLKTLMFMLTSVPRLPCLGK